MSRPTSRRATLPRMPTSTRRPCASAAPRASPATSATSPTAAHAGATMAEHAGDQLGLPLPGLGELDEAQARATGELAAAVRRSVKALDAAGLVAEHDAAR